VLPTISKPDRSRSSYSTIFADTAKMPGRARRRALASVALVCAISSVPVSPAQNSATGSTNKGTTPAQFHFLIVRPRVDVIKDTFTTLVRSDGASDAVQTGLYGVISRLFEENGYPVRFDAAQIEQWESTPLNKIAIKGLLDHYDTAFCPHGIGVPNCRPDDKPSLQDDIRNILDADQFDALVVTRGRGVEMTRSARANPYESSEPRFSFNFSIAVIDITTGRAIYNCEGAATGNYITAPDARLAGPVQGCLQPYFKSRAKPH
jgi:hypothetical protein